jgi:hypothetical protein
MPVGLDSVGPDANGAGGWTVTGATWSHTCSGSDRLLVVQATVGGNGISNVITSITYNGVGLTKVLERNCNDPNTDGYTSIWILINPDSGAHDVVVTLAGTYDLECGSTSFTGVDQTTPYVSAHNAMSSGSESVTPSLSVSSTTGNMVVGSFGRGSTLIGTFSGWTTRWLKNVNIWTAGGNGAGGTANGASTVDISYSDTGDGWAFVALDLLAASGTIDNTPKPASLGQFDPEMRLDAWF